MLHPLQKDHFAVLQRFNELRNFPLIHAVCLQQQSGFIFVDQQVEPTVVFVTNKAGFSYLYVKDGIAIDHNALLDFLAASKDVCQYIHIYEPPAITDLLSAMQAEQYGYKLRDRMQLKFRQASVSIPVANIPVTNEEISKENIHEIRAMGFDAINLFWGSEEHFLSGGYGILLKNEAGKPICICYSACVADKVAEVDIYTVPEYQNKGLAKYATALFVDRGISKGIIPNWDCFEDNVPSLKTAMNIGFEVTRKYKYLSVYFKLKTI